MIKVSMELKEEIKEIRKQAHGGRESSLSDALIFTLVLLVCRLGLSLNCDEMRLSRWSRSVSVASDRPAVEVALAHSPLQREPAAPGLHRPSHAPPAATAD